MQFTHFLGLLSLPPLTLECRKLLKICLLEDCKTFSCDSYSCDSLYFEITIFLLYIYNYLIIN